MERITLKDSNYKIIGYVEINSNGDKTLKSASYKILGYYQKSTDLTKDANYKIIGHGDILTTLLK